MREFEVLTNSYDASFGRAAGGQINVILLSGTNRLHGTVYEFLRNSKLDGTNYFALSGAPFAEKYPKPVRRLFGRSHPQRQDLLLRSTIRVTEFVKGSLARPMYQRPSSVVGDFSQSGGRLIPIDLFTQQPFPNFVIPRSRMSSVGLAIAALYPLPNRSVAGQNFVSSPAQKDRSDQFDVQLDHNFNQSSELVVPL